MPVAGNRVEGRCKGCQAKILFIYSAAGKWIPCNPVVCKVDGERMLIFADGVVARSHQQCTVGHETHFASCPQSEEFKKASKKSEEKARAATVKHVISCGCFGGDDQSK